MAINKVAELGTVIGANQNPTYAQIEEPVEAEKMELIDKKSRIIKTSEIRPLYVSDGEDVLDRLKLGKVRKKMDTAHNKILDKKVSMQKKVSVVKPKTIVGNPFDDDSWKQTSSDEEKETRIRMGEYMRVSSLYDDEYRETAKEFLDTVLPVITAEVKKLDDQIADAIMEYNVTMEEMKDNIRTAKRNRQSFLSELSDSTWGKFVQANNGTHTADDTESVWFIQNVEELCPNVGGASQIIGQLEVLRREIDILEERLDYHSSSQYMDDLSTKQTEEALNSSKSSLYKLFKK